MPHPASVKMAPMDLGPIAAGPVQAASGRLDPLNNPAMLARLDQPIAAIATAPGRAAVGIVRVSAKDVRPIIEAVCGRELPARQAVLLALSRRRWQRDRPGPGHHFPAPHSYTGEDVLELQAHGGRWCCNCCWRVASKRARRCSCASRAG
jgi:tRNA U34 5-carboxymethylaminomethyl modifying GTPase MnmE/TrmE